MKFILWTFVWFIAGDISIYVNEYLLKNTYSDSTDALAGLVYIFLWIFLYQVIIKKEGNCG